VGEKKSKKELRRGWRKKFQRVKENQQEETPKWEKIAGRAHENLWKADGIFTQQGEALQRKKKGGRQLGVRL